MIRSDSRRVKKGDIFVALAGINSDGHDYVFDAIKNGASKVVVTHGSYPVDTVVVSDTKKYLKDYLYSNYASIFNDMVLIGVTGTNGKTTVAYLLYQALNNLGIKCSMIGTLGYYKETKEFLLPNTCPDLALMYELLLDSYNSGFKYVVMEASSQGLAEERMYGIKFDYAIFTNLTHDHLDYHKTMENYAFSKQKLFNKLKSDGIGIINIDDSYSNYFKCSNMVTYGFGDCDYKVLNYSDNKFSFIHDDIYTVFHNLNGKYNVYNLMCVIIVLKCIGIDISDILSTVKLINSPKGRMETYKYHNNSIIVDYAHTPDAISNILGSISGYSKIYTVFGCTGNRDRFKRPIMTKLLLDKCDYVIITCDDLYNESFDSVVNDMICDVDKTNYEICFDRGAAISKGISLLKDNDVLLVLGKGHEEFIKIGSKLIPFNDGKYILSIINKSI